VQVFLVLVSFEFATLVNWDFRKQSVPEHLEIFHILFIRNAVPGKFGNLSQNRNAFLHVPAVITALVELEDSHLEFYPRRNDQWMGRFNAFVTQVKKIMTEFVLF